MSGLLEVMVLHEHDARRAEEGGADRVELRGSRDDGGRSPEPRLVERVRRATTLQLRPLVRLRGGFGTDGGEAVRLRGLIDSYLDAGADGVVLGFLNGLGEVDREVCAELIGDGAFPWTFDRAVDSTLDSDLAWRALLSLPRLDQVLTAGSPRGVEAGLDELIRLARSDAAIARRMLAGGGLRPEDVPWLVRAGVSSFHIATPARPQGSYKAYVDAPLVHTWRTLIDDAVRHQAQRATG